MSTFNFKKFPGVIPPTPVKRGGEGTEEGEDRKGAREGRPHQFTFLATPLFLCMVI